MISQTTLTHTDEAEAAYQQSQTLAETINPDFEGRVYAGLANVYAVRAATLPQANAGCTTGGIERDAGTGRSVRRQLSAIPPDGLGRRRAANMLLTAVKVRYCSG